MKWIYATDLENWATRIDSRAHLVELTADLIRASSNDLTGFRFPGNDKAQTRGFDGVLEAFGFPLYVPQGKSVWEFGTSKGSGKIEADFIKRTSKENELFRRENSIVLVTPYTWDKPTEDLSKWVESKKLEKSWKDVRVIDGVQLEHWLSDCPAVAAHYAKHILKLIPQTGVKSVDEFWTEYSCQFDPRLTEEVLLAGRDQQVKNLLVSLLGGPSKTFIRADSPEEVLAFAVAAIRKAPIEQSYYLSAKVLIVESAESARFLQTKNNLIYLTFGEGAERGGALAHCGPTLFPLGADQQKSNVERLARPTSDELAKAFGSMGFEHSAAYARARECGRSLTVLRRRYPGSVVRRPGWMDSAAHILPAIIAGGWDENSGPDRLILEQLISPKLYAQLTRACPQIRDSQIS